MGRKREKYWEDPERLIIVGRFYVPKLRRIDLCTSEELDYKISKKSRIKRSDKEKENYLDTLYDKTLKELLDPKDLETSGQSVQKVLQDFLDSIHVRPSSKRRMVISFNHFVIHTKKIPVTELKTWHLTTFANRMRSNRLKESTIKTNLQHVRTFLNWCYDQELIDRVPKNPKVSPSKKEKKPYQVYHIPLISKHIEKDYDISQFRCFMMLKETGMRISEVLALPLRCIDKKWIYINPHPEIDWYPKTGDEDKVPISKILRQFLDKDQRPKDHKWYLDDGFGNQHLTYGTYYRRFKRINRELGLNVKDPTHGFRGYLCSRLLAQGVDSSLIGQIVRHSDPKMTAGHYFEKQHPALQKALDLL